jgi:hypothetical protein
MKSKMQDLALPAFLSSRHALHPRAGSSNHVRWLRGKQSGMKKAL